MRAPEPPALHVILVTLNGLAETLACLADLHAQDYPRLQLHLVDNGSTDGTPERVAAAYPDVHLYPQSRNLGFAAGCNVALRHVRELGDHALLLNNDTRLAPGLLSALMARATATPNLGLLAPLIVYDGEGGRIWSAGYRRHPRLLEKVGGHDGMPAAGLRKPIACDYLTGCALLITPTALEQVGLLDERFFFTYEDLDYSLRVRQAGLQVICDPALRLRHRVSATAGVDSALQNFHLAQASVLFFAKHAPRGSVPAILLFRTGSAVRRLLRLLLARRPAAAASYLRGLRAGWQRHRAGSRSL